MTSTYRIEALPPQAEAWLRSLAAALGELQRSEREEIVSGLRLHIVEAAAEGASVDEVLAQLGSAEEVAALSLADRTPRGGLASGYWRWKRLLQLTALVFAIAATAVVLLLPGPTEVTTDQNGQLVELAEPTTLEAYGPWMLAIAAIPLTLTAVPFAARGRWWQPVSIVATVLLVAFAFIASASIGYFYAPAAICAVIALFLHPRRALP